MLLLSHVISSTFHKMIPIPSFPHLHPQIGKWRLTATKHRSAKSLMGFCLPFCLSFSLLESKICLGLITNHRRRHYFFSDLYSLQIVKANIKKKYISISLISSMEIEENVLPKVNSSYS